MAKQSKNTKSVSKPVDKDKTYVNPTERWWGKALIWFLIIGMVGLVIFGLIIALINQPSY